MSEFNAALGLLQLRHIDEALRRRAGVDQAYRRCLRGVRGIDCPEPTAAATANHAYFPILVRDDYPISRDELNDALRAHGVVPRRYFYPLISEFPVYRGLPSAPRDNLPQAFAVSRQVLCLPMYPDLAEAAVEDICRFIATR